MVAAEYVYVDDLELPAKGIPKVVGQSELL